MSATATLANNLKLKLDTRETGERLRETKMHRGSYQDAWKLKHANSGALLNGFTHCTGVHPISCPI